MAKRKPTPWSEQALRELEGSGQRPGSARRAVVDLLAAEDCCMTAQEITEELRARGSSVGLASVYRTLEALDRSRLVQKLDTGDGTARFEAIDRDGEHHHHVVCDSCGNWRAFADPALERAIAQLSRRLDYSVSAHDVTLRGACPQCEAAEPEPA